MIRLIRKILQSSHKPAHRTDGNHGGRSKVEDNVDKQTYINTGIEITQRNGKFGVKSKLAKMSVSMKMT